jgi:hypothetical protein
VVSVSPFGNILNLILVVVVVSCTGARSYIFISSGTCMYKKEEGRTLFGGPKVKVEFRHLFSLQKRFSLCSSHKINANIDIFCWLTGLQWNNSFLNSKRFGQLLILNSGLYGLNIKVSFHWSKDLNWHFCGKLFTHLVKRYF